MVDAPVAKRTANLGLGQDSPARGARLRPAGDGSSHDAELVKSVQILYRRRRQANRLTIALGQLAVVLVFLGIWQFVSGRLLDAQAVSDPVAVFAALAMLVETGRLWPDLWQTLVEILSGFAVGSALALGLAFVLALVPSAQAVLRPFLLAFYAIPKIALAPLIVMWFGLGTLPKIVMAGAFVFFIVFMNAMGGVESVEPNHLLVARIMGAGRLTLFRKIVLPSTLPFLLVGFRLAIPEAITGCVIAEFITSDVGIGHLISSSSQQLNTAVSLAGVVVLLIIVAIADLMLGAIERNLMRWKPAAKAKATD